MRVKNRSIAWRLFVTTPLTLVLAACGGSVGTTGEGTSQTPTATTEPASQADPLEGEWRTEFTCQDSVRAIGRRLSAKQIEEQAGSLVNVLQDHWQVKPTKDNPCRGATETVALLARFADGNLALGDAETGTYDVSASYELLDGHSISVNDPSENLCPCPGVWEFEIADDQVTFHVEPDPWIVGTWEAAPWVREN
jgi:hypothetical protein